MPHKVRCITFKASEIVSKQIDKVLGKVDCLRALIFCASSVSDYQKCVQLCVHDICK